MINKATWNDGETFLIFKATDLDGKTSQQKVTVTVKQPIPPLKIKDLTGAGDLFAAGYLHGYLNKFDEIECLNKGREMSTKVIQQIGARL